MKAVTLEHSEILFYGHDPGQCGTTVCSLHNRSDHAMRKWKQRWNKDLYRMERRCPHGWEHPDPDHIAYVKTFMPHVMLISTMRHVATCDCCEKICRPLLEAPNSPATTQQAPERGVRRYSL